MTFPQGLPGPEFCWHVPPRRPRAEPPGDRLQHLPVITPPPPPPPLIRGQHRLDQLPQLVRDHTGSDHSPIIGEPAPNIWETRPRSPRSIPTPQQLVSERLPARAVHLCRVQGAIPGTPFLIALIPAYVAVLWERARLLMRIAALHGRDPGTHQVAAEILAPRRIYNSVD